MVDTEKQTAQVWNTKYDRHRHAHTFLLTLPWKAKQLIMTDVEVALQPPDFWLLGTHPAPNDPSRRWGECGWKTKNRKKREVCGGFFCLWKFRKVHVSKQLLTADNCWLLKQKHSVLKRIVFNSIRHKLVIFGWTIQSFQLVQHSTSRASRHCKQRYIHLCGCAASKTTRL